MLSQLNFKNQQTHRKRDQICGYQRRGWGNGDGGGRVWGGLDEGSQKLQTSSYKINKY